ncbi:dermonecrotic toxin domain-containing protein [Pseudomonas putida]
MTQTTPLTVENVTIIADRYYENFPDLQDAAKDWGIKLLKFHTGLDLDPDEVYWHDFDNAQNSSLAHTGQQHMGKPKTTLSVTELILRRFNTFYQVNFDLLDQMSGFYKVKSAGIYNEANEVPLAPSAIMREFWATDFSNHYQQRLKNFLSLYADDGRMLIKMLFFSFSWNAYNAGSLSDKQLKLVFNTFAGATGFPPTLDDIKATHTQRTQATVHSFSLGDLVAQDILRIKAANGAEILYLPAGWFRSFHGEQQMYEWVAETAADEHARERLMGHFNTLDDSSQPPRNLLLKTLEYIRTTPWQANQRVLNGASAQINQDVFTFLFNTVRKRLELDAKELLTSNRELRKELFLVDLEAFMRIVTPMAPGDPAIALVAVAAGSLAFGSHLANAVHGKTRESRSKAFRAAVIDALNILLDMPLLRGAGDSALNDLTDLANADLTGEEMVEIDRAQPGNAALDAIATGEDLYGLSEGTGIYQGVYTRADGNHYVRMDGQVFQVLYIEVLERWVIVDPISPQQIKGSWPIERNWLGRWEPLGIPVPTTQAPVPDAVDLLDSSPDYHDVTELLINPNAGQLMSGSIDSVLLDARSDLIRLREDLGKQAQAFFLDPPGQIAPTLPVLTSNTTPKGFFQQVFATGKGLVVNGTGNNVGGCQLLIKYMSTLKAQRVKTLYVQGLLKDLHQDLIDQFLQTGKFSRKLEKQLQRLHNLGQGLDNGKYTLRGVLMEARRQAIAVKALDCAASLSSDGVSAAAPNLAQRMRVYYAFKRIETLQSAKPDEKWVAMTDQTLANHYGQTPGLANLTNTLSLRVKIAEGTLPLRFSLDTGESVKPGLIPVKGDISLRVPGSADPLYEDALR